MRVKQRELPEELPWLGEMSPILQRIYAARGITDEAQLDRRLQKLLTFDSLTDIDKACIRLKQALVLKQRILIIGDFDADGATSTAVAILALRAMGAETVDYLVPNRFEFGYGLTPGLVEVACRWKPDLIITVDNGIASIEGVDSALKAGIDVLITDHHLPGEVLPKACAIVNPNQNNDVFQSKSVAGVGVIFYVMAALRRHLVETGWFMEQNLSEPNMGQFLDLVALGTVADVVALDQNNRILVNQGLGKIRLGQCRPGIKALIEVAGKNISTLRESDLGFSLAPRLNAAGRLDDMSLGIECLISDDKHKADVLAAKLNELNQERRVIEADMKEQALLAIDKLTQQWNYAGNLPLALCLMDESWHQGVIGILAGRMKERYHRPVLVFAKVSPTELKGSARSVAGVNIRDILAAVDKDNPGLIVKFGGHAMAAGISLSPENFTAFRQAFIAEVGKHLDASQCEGICLTDGALTPSDMNIQTALMLAQAGPWGQQFPVPSFDNVFEVLEQRLVGQNHLKMTLMLPSGEPVDAIAFQVDTDRWPDHRVKQIHAVYTLDINVYQGRTKLQLLVEALWPLG